ncbi:hypothetical protein C2S51_036519 [Perilla frutescens var. frutescens]|nr:hypothetical protein C2S51_036519 [Perilla frutescens var. frutescens]
MEVVDKSSRNREESKISEEVENGDSRGKKGDVVVDINGDDNGRSRNSDEDSNAENLCRICHFSDDESTGDSQLIKLGCDCRGELGVSHRNCADAWFSQKGNRVCEICGKTAKNISRRNEEASDSARLMMELSEIRLVVETLDSSDEGSRRYGVHGRTCKHAIHNDRGQSLSRVI